jgi:hypothetical protein
VSPLGAKVMVAMVLGFGVCCVVVCYTGEPFGFPVFSPNPSGLGNFLEMACATMRVFISCGLA